MKDRAWAWLQSLPANSITSWAQLKVAFLKWYFPPSKTTQVGNEINNFRQEEGESLFDAWEHFKDLLRICPFHGLEKWMIIHTFYNGLLYSTRMTLDAAPSRALMNSTQDVAYNLIEEMTKNHHH